jgi:hypothetical protein
VPFIGKPGNPNAQPGELEPGRPNALTQKASSGTLSPAAALVRQALRRLAGAATPAGGPVKRASRAFSGALTSAGTAGRGFFRAFAGIITSAGALTRRPGKILSGSLLSAGALRRDAARRLVGVLTTSGSAVRRAARTLSGSLTSSGATTRRAFKLLTAALPSAAGGVTRRIGRAVGGTLSPTSALSALVRSLLAGLGRRYRPRQLRQWREAAQVRRWLASAAPRRFRPTTNAQADAMSHSSQFEKDPDEVLDFSILWDLILGADTIVTSAWAVSGVTKDSDTFSATVATIVVSGGVAGTSATATNTITTAAGRTHVRSLTLLVRDL